MSTQNKHIKTIKRRVDHLANRILKSTSDLSFDKAELTALQWALEKLEEKEKS